MLADDGFNPIFDSGSRPSGVVLAAALTRSCFTRSLVTSKKLKPHINPMDANEIFATAVVIIVAIMAIGASAALLIGLIP